MSMRRRRFLTMGPLMLVAAGCGGPSGPSATSGWNVASPAPTPPQGPLAKLLVSPSRDSVDVMSLFTQPAGWATARQYVRTFSVPDLDLQAPRNRFTDAELGLIASSLPKWSIDFALEVGAVKEWGCASPVTVATTSLSIDRWKAAGGRIASLAMDEPLWAGTNLPPNGCGYDLERTAAETLAYMDEMVRRNPGLRIGDIEPWPAIDGPTIVRWIARLRTDAPGGLSFFRLDIDAQQVKPGPNSPDNPKWNEVVDIANYCRSVGVPFSVIVWNSNLSAPKSLDSDERFYGDSLALARFLRDRLPALAEGGDDIPIMAWGPFPRMNLPDDAGYSFSQLIRDFGREFIGT